MFGVKHAVELSDATLNAFLLSNDLLLLATKLFVSNKFPYFTIK